MTQSNALDPRWAAARALLDSRRHAKRGKPERSLLTITDLSAAEIVALLDAGIAAKKDPSRVSRALAGKSVALLFQKTSTRTRVSFEIGIGEMGGQPMFLDWRTSNFTLADLQDEIRVLSRYVDLVMARVNRHEDLVTMKAFSEVPIINGLCDRFHPCQALTDAMTIKEYFGELRGLKIAYVGDGNNVCHSLMEIAVACGMSISVAHPDGYAPNAEIVAAARKIGSVSLTRDPNEAVRGADVVYTDTWVSMGSEGEKEQRLAAFKTYQVDEALLALAPSHALVMHCLPAHRGYEISGGALDSVNSVVVDQAENRKHVQKALLASILRD